MNFRLQVQLSMKQNELLSKAERLSGLTFLQLAQSLDIPFPMHITHAKGWLGQAVELFLGARSGSLPQPDFPELCIELKTLPLNQNGKVAESTYVTVLNLMHDLECQWQRSVCFQKLQRVLWVPVEGDKSIPFMQRRIGKPILWSPDETQGKILQQDFEMIMEMVLKGQVEQITGSLGQYLHVRPKAANSSVTTKGFNETGDTINTLPRGFYLRTQLTNQIVATIL